MPLVKEEKRPKAKNKKYSRQKKATCTTSKHSWFGAPQLRAANQPPATQPATLSMEKDAIPRLGPPRMLTLARHRTSGCRYSREVREGMAGRELAQFCY
jgi:hypothetical protein